MKTNTSHSGKNLAGTGSGKSPFTGKPCNTGK